MTLTCRRGLRAGPRVLSPPAKPEYRGLCCAARVLNAIHYPGMGAVVIIPMGRGEGQSRQKVNGSSSAREVGRSNSQRGGGGVASCVCWIRRAGCIDGAETGRNRGWNAGDRAQRRFWKSAGVMGKAGEASVSPGTEVRRSKCSQWGNEKLGGLPGSRAPGQGMRGGTMALASQGRGQGWGQRRGGDKG